MATPEALGDLDASGGQSSPRIRAEFASEKDSKEKVPDSPDPQTLVQEVVVEEEEEASSVSSSSSVACVGGECVCVV